MIEEAISKIEQMADEARGARVVETRFGNGYWMQHGGALTWHDAPLPNRQHCVFTVEDFIAAGVMAADKWSGQPIVWHSHERLVLVIDDRGYRCDTVTLALKPSGPFRALHTSGNPRKQKDFLALLKQDLRNCVDPSIATSVRSIKWAVNSEGTSEVRQGRESMGQSVNKALTGEADLPEDVTADVPVYENIEKPTVPDRTYDVQCLLVADAGDQVFRLMPLPGELAGAIHSAQGDLRKRLEDGLPGVPILFGTP